MVQISKFSDVGELRLRCDSARVAVAGRYVAGLNQDWGAAESHLECKVSGKENITFTKGGGKVCSLGIIDSIVVVFMGEGLTVIPYLGSYDLLEEGLLKLRKSEMQTNLIVLGVDFSSSLGALPSL